MNIAAPQLKLHALYKIAGVIAFIIATLLLIAIVFYFRYKSAFTFAVRAEDYEVRSRLLMEAMDKVGVCSAKDAAKLWAEGLRLRSGALQYAAMNRELKAQYKAALETNAPNWVTGISSPWIDSYDISTLDSQFTACMFGIKFITATSAGPAQEHRAVLTVAQEDGFWRISKLVIDPELFPYTRFLPNN